MSMALLYVVLVQNHYLVKKHKQILCQVTNYLHQKRNSQKPTKTYITICIDETITLSPRISTINQNKLVTCVASNWQHKVMGLCVIQIPRFSIKRSLHYNMLSIQNSNSMRKVPFILKNLRYLFLFLLSRRTSQKSFFHKKLTYSIAHFYYNCTHRADGLIV